MAAYAKDVDINATNATIGMDAFVGSVTSETRKLQIRCINGKGAIAKNAEKKHQPSCTTGNLSIGGSRRKKRMNGMVEILSA